MVGRKILVAAVLLSSLFVIAPAAQEARADPWPLTQKVVRCATDPMNCNPLPCPLLECLPLEPL